MDINFKPTNEYFTIPTYGTPYSAGADLYAAEPNPVHISPSTTKSIHTGMAVEIPEGYFGAIFPRSGLSTKKGLAPANKVGVIDSDYRGEVIVKLYNHSNSMQTIFPNDRIAQLILIPYKQAKFHQVDSLSDTERADNGFGSTGR